MGPSGGLLALVVIAAGLVLGPVLFQPVPKGINKLPWRLTWTLMPVTSEDFRLYLLAKAS